ncbi:MAG: hypothetical protein HWN67_17165 [Candidatus Helarchaeota archaeon]|nr:hypothetical protein [Candidatus Helarchaeota archaeon]
MPKARWLKELKEENIIKACKNAVKDLPVNKREEIYELCKNIFNNPSFQKKIVKKNTQEFADTKNNLELIKKYCTIVHEGDIKEVEDCEDVTTSTLSDPEFQKKAAYLKFLRSIDEDTLKCIFNTSIDSAGNIDDEKIIACLNKPNKGIKNDLIFKETKKTTKMGKLKLVLQNPNSEIRQLMDEYEQMMGKRANRGLKFTKIFKNWLIDKLDLAVDKKNEYLKLIDEIDQKEVYRNLIIDLIYDIRNLSLREIAKEIGIDSLYPILKIAAEILGENYHMRFPSPKEKYDDEDIKRIIKLIKNERNLPLEIIAEEAGVDSIYIVRKIAKKILSDVEYEKRFPYRIDEKKKRKAWQLMDNPKMSLKKIANEVGISQYSAAKIAQEKFGEHYRKKYNYGKIDEEKEKKIIDLIFDDRELSQVEIAEEAGVKSTTPVERIAHEILGAEYGERFPPHGGISKKKEKEIIRLINSTKMGLKEIADKVGIGSTTVGRRAKEYLKNDFKKRFPRDTRFRTGIKFHTLFQSEVKKIVEPKGIMVYTEYETLKAIPRFQKQGIRGDFVIEVDESLREKHKIPDDIKFIVVEITIDKSQKKANETIEKGYHGKDTMLLHSPWSFGKKLRQKRKYKIPEGTMFKKNILFLPGEDLLNYLDFTEVEKKEFLSRLQDAYNKAKSQKTLKEFFEEED